MNTIACSHNIRPERQALLTRLIKQVCCCAGWIPLFGMNAFAASFTVINTLDDGPGSLRQAILDANNAPGFDRILFNIPGSGIKNIRPNSALPAIRERVLIDGTSQLLPTGLPSIQLNGNQVGALVDGLTIEASECEVRGMIVNRFGGAGILIQDGCCSIIAGNFIGTSNGRDDLGNGGPGVHILGSRSNLIGGTLSRDRNIISGNQGNGILIENDADRNLVFGNLIGVDATGTNRLANQNRGVSIRNASFNQIGGEQAGYRNVISGNRASGVAMDSGASGNVVQGNFIGTDVSGIKAIPSGSESEGVRLLDAGTQDNLIGGASLAARNVISGNSLDGVRIGEGASRNVVQGNLIGTDVTGALPVPNGGRGGVRIADASNNSIGGTGAGAGNRIAFNTENGIFINNPFGTAVGNVVLGNSIFSNGELGIDLSPTGQVTTNDFNDIDGGANRQQNYPVLTLASNTASGLVIKGTLNTVPFSAVITVEFFDSDDCDPTGHGEGRTFLGRTTVSTGADGSAELAVMLPVSAVAGNYLTATATLDNNTSEFSRCLLVTEFQPTLEIRGLNEDRVLLEWMDHTGQFELEFNSADAGWLPSPEQPQIAGELRTLVWNVVQSSTFFRLRKAEHETQTVAP